MVGSLICAIIAAVAAIGGSFGSPLLGVSSAILTLAGFALSYRVWQLSVRRRLYPAQRGILLRDLSRIAPIDVRVSAVDEAEPRAYAQQLLDVFVEAGCKAEGVFVDRTNAANVGVFLAIKGDTPPDEARLLLNALIRVGVDARESRKAGLPNNRTVEILVGLRSA